MNEEKAERVRKAKTEIEETGRELRYTQQVVAGELAGWQEMHERLGRRAVRELARGMVVRERVVLEGLRRALRKVRANGSNSAMNGTGAGVGFGQSVSKREPSGAVVEEVVEVNGGSSSAPV